MTKQEALNTLNSFVAKIETEIKAAVSDFNSTEMNNHLDVVLAHLNAIRSQILQIEDGTELDEPQPAAQGEMFDQTIALSQAEEAENARNTRR